VLKSAFPSIQLLSALISALAVPCLALEDFPVYLDAGCGTEAANGLGNGYAQGPADMLLGRKANGDKTVPVSCDEKLSGSDAMVIKLARTLANGEHWDFGVKFADDRAWSVKPYADIRMWIRNKGASATKIRVGLDIAGSYSDKMDTLSIPVAADWKEFVVPLSRVGGDSAYGIKLSHVAGTSVDLLVDSVRLTDGTGLHPIAIPAVVRNAVPANWGRNFLLGSFDNRELGKSTKAQQAGMAYRYQYVMPDIKTYYSRSGKGYVYDYSMLSDTLGVKTAVVWYNLGKTGEGWSPVTANLADAAYMADYFDRFDWMLDQLAMAGQSDNMIIVEPDMYGFLMRGPQGSIGKPIDDPAVIPVNMERAAALSGRAWDANLAGWAKYLVWRARQKLPKGVIIGHMPNHWGVSIPGQVGQGRKEAHIISGNVIGAFLSGFGKDGMGDVVFVEKTDHDAGHKPGNENWLWDSTAYAKYFLWTRVIANKTGLPICGWQVSEGNLSNEAKWKDDAAETFLAHPDWFMDGGFVGILFGAGNPDCVNYLDDSDGGWFVDRMTEATKAPIPLLTVGIRERRGPALRSRKPAIRISPHGTPLIEWPDNPRAALRDVQGRRAAPSKRSPVAQESPGGAYPQE
jgi:hypothetical protein